MTQPTSTVSKIVTHGKTALEIAAVGGLVVGAALGAAPCALLTLGVVLAIYAMIKVYNYLKDKSPFLARLVSMLAFAAVAALTAGVVLGAPVMLPMLGISAAVVCSGVLGVYAFMRSLILLQDIFAANKKAAAKADEKRVVVPGTDALQLQSDDDVSELIGGNPEQFISSVLSRPEVSALLANIGNIIASQGGDGHSSDEETSVGLSLLRGFSNGENSSVPLK